MALLTTAFLFPLGGATLVLPWYLALRIAQLFRGPRPRSIPRRLGVPIALFLGLALLAGVLSPLPSVALGSWALAALAFAVVLPTVIEVLNATPELLRPLHQAVASGAIVAAVYGFVAVYVEHPATNNLWDERAHLPALGGNALGFGLMAAVFLIVPLLRTRGVWPVIYAAALVVVIAGILATFSRAALYGLVAGGVVCLWLEGRKWPAWLAAVVVLSVALSLLIVLNIPLVQQLLTIQLKYLGLELRGPATASAIFRQTLEFLLSSAGNTDRLPIWRSAVTVIRHHPWLGVGLGVFPFIVHQSVPAIPPGTTPHSIYLDLAAETGIPAALAYLTAVAAALVWAWRHGTLYRNAAVAATVAMLAAELRDAILIGFHMALGFLLILGLLVAPDGEARRHVSSKDTERDLGPDWGNNASHCRAGTLRSRAATARPG